MGGFGDFRSFTSNFTLETWIWQSLLLRMKIMRDQTGRPEFENSDGEENY